MIKMRIDDLIMKRGLRKGYIAKAMQINANTLSNWVSSRSYPRLDQAVQLAKILGCEVNDLYEDRP